MNLDEIKEFNRQNRPWLVGVWLYGTIGLIIFSVGFFTYPSFFISYQEDLSAALSTRLFWRGAMAGGIGGAINMLFSLSQVVMRGKRDPEYLNVFYYLAQPFIGITFGVGVLILVVIIIQLFSDDLGQVTNNLYIAVIPSYVAGYLQRTILRAIYRFIESFRPKVDEVQNDS
jgi:hypothetical protein